MKGFIQQIKDGDNVHHVTDEEAKKLIVFFNLIGWNNASTCHGANLNINSEGITCSYCGKVQDDKDFL